MISVRLFRVCRLVCSRLIIALCCPFYLVAIFSSAIFVRFARDGVGKRLVWGSTPIINNSHWSRSMKEAGFSSVTYTDGFYNINSRDDWDLLLSEEYSRWPPSIRPYLAFYESIFKYDIFFISFDGFFIGKTWLWWIQAPVFRLANKKVVLIPYGADAFVYNRIRSPALVYGLLASYPEAAKQQCSISRRVDYWVRYSDFFMPGNIGMDGFGRWDLVAHSCLFLDVDDWVVSDRINPSDGVSGTVVVAHFPNHRGFKGTEFVLEAIRCLRDEGLNVELLLLEGVSNAGVKYALQNDVDILVEQLVFTGHSLSALEGMASGVPVVSNLEDGSYIDVFRRYSYFNECPVVSASPENVADVLRQLILNPSLRGVLGGAGRKYVERYHSVPVAQRLFSEIVSHLNGERGGLFNYFNPHCGEFEFSGGLLKPPLVKNRLTDYES